MARKTELLVIDGTTFEITQLPATEGLLVYNKLLRVLGPVIRSALGEPELTSAAKSADADAPEKAITANAGLRIASIILQGFEALDPAFTLELAQQFSRNTNLKLESAMVPLSAGDIFDQHFAGRYAHMTRWLVAHLKLNFSDFLVALVGSAASKPAV